MKNKCLLLLKIQLYKMMGFNRMRYSKDPKDRYKSIGQFVLYAFLVFVLCSYSFLLSFGFGVIGMMHEVPVLLMAIASIFVLVTTFIKCNGVLFGFRDYELLTSLPVKPQDIIISRFLSMYIMNVLFTCAVMIPACIAKLIMEDVSIGFLFVYILSVFIIPLIPMMIATIAGTIILFVSRRMKYRSLVTTILTLGLCSVIIFLSFAMQNMGMNEIEVEKMGQAVMEQVNQLYPLAFVYRAAICEGNITAFFMYIFGSMIVFVVFVWLVSKKYGEIHTAIATYKQKGNYKLQSLSAGSAFMALYKKELKRYFSSSVYVTNTFIGDIMMIAFAVCFIFLTPEQVAQYFDMPDAANWLKDAIPYVMAFICCMSCTTAASISLERKNLWILESLPIDNKMIYRSKMAVNLTITIPAIVISAVILIFTLQTNVWQSVLLFVTPMVYAIFSAQFGIIMNLLFPNFQWDSEVEVVKQGAATMCSILGGMITVFIVGFFAVIFGKEHIFFTSMILNVVLLAITALMYHLAGKKKLQTLID